MKKSVSFSGLTPTGRAKVAKRALSGNAIINAMRKLGMTDEEIKQALLERQAKQIVAGEPAKG